MKEKKRKYSVDYCGVKECYIRARDSYRPGKKVKIFYKCIASDTQYTFYLDGIKLNCYFHNKKGLIIRFVMPEHNVKLECITKNLMVDDIRLEK
ncbi:MAG: hypothetical protein IKL22_02630 [Lachnospiraceae bacterium]|nr:hypothetical protein [Lachnospiraceae bacterium]